GIGVEGEELLEDRDDELGPSFGICREDGRVPGLLDAAGGPDLAPGLPVEGIQGAALDAGVDDHQILVNHRRRRRAPAVRPVTDLGPPELLSLVVEGERPRFPEEDVDALLIRGGSAGGVAVGLAVLPLLRLLGRLLLRPERLAAFLVEAEEVTLQLAEVALPLPVAGVAGEVDPPALDDRTRRAGPGQLGLPDEVFFRTPGGGQTRRGADPQATRPAELRPVGARCAGDE